MWCCAVQCGAVRCGATCVAMLRHMCEQGAAAAPTTVLSAALAPLQDNIDIYILAYAVMLGASAVFASSFGYQVSACCCCSCCYRCEWQASRSAVQISLMVLGVVATQLALACCWFGLDLNDAPMLLPALCRPT